MVRDRTDGSGVPSRGVFIVREAPMAQRSPAHRRALIVEDEDPGSPMGLTADMQALGFDFAISRQAAKTPFCRQWRMRPISS